MLALVLAAPSVAWADGLDGTWVLDLPASDSNDPLLQSQGVNWVVRQAAKRMIVTQVIDDRGKDVTIDVKTSWRNSHYALRVDGVERNEVGEDGRTAEALHYREPDGSLVSHMRMITPDGHPGIMVIHRQLKDGGRTMLQTTTWTEVGKPALVIHRVFHLAQGQGEAGSVTYK
jgi:hypothetical protein